jgi:microcin C transport system permease protein
MLTKNSFLDEIGKQYVLTARAKGLSEKRVLYGHIFRNAMLIVIAGFPAAFMHIFFTGSLLIEVIFSLDGLGLLVTNPSSIATIRWCWEHCISTP